MATKTEKKDRADSYTSAFLTGVGSIICLSPDMISNVPTRTHRSAALRAHVFAGPFVDGQNMRRDVKKALLRIEKESK